MQLYDYRKPSEFAREHLYYSDGLGIRDDMEFFIDRESFRNNLMLYVESGRFHLEQNGQHILRAGDFVIMRLSDKHKYYSDKKDVCKVVWMHFGEPQSCPLMTYIENEATLPYMSQGHWMYENLMACINISKTQNVDRELFYSQKVYENLLNTCSQINRGKENDSHDSKSKFVHMINLYIDAHIHATPKLDDFASACGFSRYHFIKIFKKYVGDTPIHYYYCKKINYAKSMLSYSGESIGNIALLLGFDSPSHFSIYFKKVTGLTPRDYKNLQD